MRDETKLLHSHALGEIARLVGRQTSLLGDEVGEHLQWNRVEHGTQQRLGCGHLEELVRDVTRALVTASRNQNRLRTARSHLCDVRQHLLVERLARHYSDYGYALLDEGYRAVLELARGIALRVQIADLLELQCPFQSNGNPDSSSDEQNIGGHRVTLGGAMNVVLKQKSLLDLIGQRPHRLDRLRQLVRRHGSARLRQIQGQQIERNQLTGKGFRCGHTDLGPRVCEQNRVCFSCDRGTHDVRYRNNAGAHLLCESQRRERVCSLAGLSNSHNQRPVVEDGIAIPELGGKVELYRKASPVFDRMLCSHS